MSRYIRCCYCGTPLGEIQDFAEVPTSAYCVSCFKDWKDDELPEQLQEWER